MAAEQPEACLARSTSSLSLSLSVAISWSLPYNTRMLKTHSAWLASFCATRERLEKSIGIFSCRDIEPPSTDRFSRTAVCVSMTETSHSPMATTFYHLPTEAFVVCRVCVKLTRCKYNRVDEMWIESVIVLPTLQIL